MVGWTPQLALAAHFRRLQAWQRLSATQFTEFKLNTEAPATNNFKNHRNTRIMSQLADCCLALQLHLGQHHHSVGLALDLTTLCN